MLRDGRTTDDDPAPRRGPSSRPPPADRHQRRTRTTWPTWKDWQNFTLQQSCSKIIHTCSIQYIRAKQGCANALSQTAAIATCVHLHLCTCLSLPPGYVIVVMYV